jgi:hypothetical protein
MTETERLLRRQAEWQHRRLNLSWPEKIRQAEQLRATVVALRAEGRRRAAGASSIAPPVTVADLDAQK